MSHQGKIFHSLIFMYNYTFKVKKLDAVIGPENTHRCRIHPHEAAIFSLQAKGRNVEMFKSVSKAALTVEVDEKKEDSSVEIPVNFSKADLAKVKYSLFVQFCTFVLILTRKVCGAKDIN